MRRRADGSFERIDWDTAITEIAGKLSAIREKHGGQTLALAGIGGQANHMDGAFGLSWLGALGSKRWYNAFAQEKHQHFLMDQWMFDSAPSSWFHMDQANARFLLVMGTNPRISNRGHAANDTFRELAEREDCRVVVVDPRETETTRQADGHLKVKPGADAFLLLGIAATIASSEGLTDAGFVAEKTRDFEKLREALAQVDVDEMARRCDVPREQIEAVTGPIEDPEEEAPSQPRAPGQLASHYAPRLPLRLDASGAGLDMDFNGDQTVDFLDLGVMKQYFFGPPGPSGVALE